MMIQIYNYSHHLRCLFIVAISLLAGCESTPTALERNFGASVRDMIELQTASPGDKGFGLDGRKSEAIIEKYRKDVAEPKKVEESIIQIQLGK
jgi:hypothetical protein